MSGKTFIENECQRLNQKRNLIEDENLSLKEVSKNLGGDILISGGGSYYSKKFLLELINNLSFERDLTTIVLSNSIFLVELMEKESKFGKNGSIISGFGYKNYHVFSEFPKLLFLDMILDTARLENIDRKGLREYTSAFLEILFYGKERSSLSDFLKLLEKNAQDLTSLAEKLGINDDLIFDLKENMEASRNLYQIGLIFREVFSNVWKEGENPINYCQDDFDKYIKIFDMRSYKHKIINQYIKYLLYILLKKGPIRLVVNDIDISFDEELFKTIMDFKKREDVQLIFASTYALNMVEGREDLLGDFANIFIMPHPSAVCDNKMGNLFGQYDYYQAISGKSGSRTMVFSSSKSSNRTMSSQKVSRISYEDLEESSLQERKIAIKMEANSSIYLCKLDNFLFGK